MPPQFKADNVQFQTQNRGTVSVANPAWTLGETFETKPFQFLHSNPGLRSFRKRGGRVDGGGASVGFLYVNLELNACVHTSILMLYGYQFHLRIMYDRIIRI